MRKALAHLRKGDSVMRRIIEEVGPYRIRYSPADFSTIVRCIAYQQLSGKAALKIYSRLEAETGDAGVTPDSVLTVQPERMRELGMSRGKIAYIREFAEGCLAGEIDLEALHGMEDEAVMKTLTARKGIGPWTVHMYQIFSLRRPDVLPVGDLGIRVAMRQAYGLDELPQVAEMKQIAVPWRPYATVASWYLWRSLGDGAGLDPEG